MLNYLWFQTSMNARATLVEGMKNVWISKEDLNVFLQCSVKKVLSSANLMIHVLVLNICERRHRKIYYVIIFIVDVNECSRGIHICLPSQICKNYHGYYTCECPPGHHLNKRTNECEDLDECKMYRVSI